MKFLLAAVNAKFIHSNPAVYSLRGYARERMKQSDIDIAEFTVNEPREGILRALYKRRPDVLAFSCYIWNIQRIGELLPDIRKILPETDIWLGGPEVSFRAPELLRDYPFLAGIMAGEGEETFYRLVQCYEKTGSTLSQTGTSPESSAVTREKPDFSGLSGVCLKGFTEKDIRPVKPLFMDDLPFFYEEYGNTPDLGPFANRILYYETSRGCPFRCSYCLSSVEKSLRFRSLEKVFRELRFFLDRKVRQVKFIDRTFNTDRERALQIWDFLRENDNGVTNFHFEIAGDLLTDREIECFRKMRPGLIQLEIGVQSVNPETLKAIDRGTDFTVLAKRVAEIRALHNIHLHLDLIAGLPYENMESFRNSFNVLYRMGGNELQLGFLKVLYGTKMAENAADYGIERTFLPPYEVLRTRWISYGELAELKGVEEMLETYGNSGQFTKTLETVLPLFESPYGFFKALSDYYNENGFDLLEPARAKKYEILYAFLRERFPAEDALFKELLTYDFVLRELPKKRLSFFPDYGKEKNFPEFSSDGHGERFRFPLWEADFSPETKPAENPKILVFNYKFRDPLTGNAAVKVLPE